MKLVSDAVMSQDYLKNKDNVESVLMGANLNSLDDVENHFKKAGTYTPEMAALKKEHIEIDMKCYEESNTIPGNSEKFKDIKSYPTIKISKIDKSGKKELEYTNREPEVFIKQAFEACSDKLQQAILAKYNSLNTQMTGGYFDYINKPHLKYYGAYLKYKQKYLALKHKK
jgi:hypothetical protein